MSSLPPAVEEFLRGGRLAVAGVSRDPRQTANAVYRKLRACGHDVVPVNPNASEVEGVACYPNVGDVPAPLDGLVIVTRPEAAAGLVRDCAARGVRRVWFHRSFGRGSVSPEAVAECRERHIDAIVGGCPLMYCAPVDFGHRCMRWWLRRQGRVPG
jgi:predicted CoA-binding protein